MNRKLITLIALTIPVLTAACDRPPAEPEATADAQRTDPLPVSAMDFSIDYNCPDGTQLKVHYRDDAVMVHLSGEDLVLPQTISASGARYSNDHTTVWNKGRELTVEQTGEPEQVCTENPAQSVPPSP